MRTTDIVPDLDLLARMTATLSHRGPDGAGYYRDSQVALGHARLSIIDLAGGTQPMTNEDGTVWVTFNGEIFNYIELTRELQSRGHTFRTRSDTEVIVHAWEEWGLDCFTRFNGQWAVAIWDRRTRDLVLSRDPFGILPLHFTRVRGRVLFASDIRSLFCDAEVPREFDPDGFAETLTFWSTVAPRTAFTGVRQVEPGTSVVFGEGADYTHRYWEHAYPAETADTRSDIDTSAEQLREALIDATRLRFERSDVPVAAYLSGGIDSAVTAAIITRYTDAQLRTYSLRFSEGEYDEGSFQHAVSRDLGTDHQEITVSGSDIAAVFPDVVRHTQTPILRAGPAPMFLLSRLVHDSGHKVVVTGEGSDEMLAGYDIFREAAVRRFWARQPESAVRGRAVELLYPWMQRSPNQAPAFARSFFARNLDPDDPLMSHRPRWDSTATLQGMLTADFAARIGADPVDGIRERMPSASGSWHPLSRAQWLEHSTLLPGYVLSSQGDRMLMAHSIEGRFPFLDPNVARIAAQLPPRHKLMGLDEKHVLKRAFADIVPSPVLNRPKQPYRAPDASSFFGSGTPDWLIDVLAPDAVREAGVFQPEIVRKLVEKCERARGRTIGNADNMRLLAVLSTQLLYRDMIADKHVAAGKPPILVRVRDELDRLGTHE